MYIPQAFREERVEVLREFIRRNPFCVIATTGPDGLQASHVPAEFDDAAAPPHGLLRGHLSRANPQWRDLAAGGRVVPTWNYVAVHVRGKARTFDDPGRLRALLDDLTDRNERGRPEPWAVSDAPADYIAEASRAIVGFEIIIERLEGKWKLGQNRPAADRAGVDAALREGNERERELADADAQ